MKRFLSLTLVITGIVFLLAACQDKTISESSDQSDEDSPVVSVGPVIEVELDKLLTAAEVTEIIGSAVGEPQLFEDGIWVRFSSEDYTVNVDINMQQASQDLFDTTISMNYPDAADDPETGENCKWSAENGELLQLAKGYMIGVRVEIPKAKEDALHIACRRLMALVTSRLP